MPLPCFELAASPISACTAISDRGHACSNKKKAESANAVTANQNPEVSGFGTTSAGNPLGRMSMGKPTTDQLEKASVVKL